MTDARYVLDASAILAALFDEPGSGWVADRMESALVSAVNYQEVIAKLVDRGSPAKAVAELIDDLGMECIAADRHQAEIAGLLRAETRRFGLSLGDRSCLALALLYDRVLSQPIAPGAILTSA